MKNTLFYTLVSAFAFGALINTAQADEHADGAMTQEEAAAACAARAEESEDDYDSVVAACMEEHGFGAEASEGEHHK